MACPFAVSGYNKRGVRLWANGDAQIVLLNSDYNYWTENGGDYNAVDPPTAALPVVDIEASFNKNTQILLYAGRRAATGTIGTQGTAGYYWPNTPSNSTYGYYMYFSSTVIEPVGNTGYLPYAQGIPIRCVRI
jgi:hypothetical protein